ncbi:MAG: DsrE family protein [Thiohalospira sp.]
MSPRALRSLTATLSLLALVAALTLPRPAPAQEPDAKVVYHADFADPQRFSAMLTSINNMMTHYNDQLMEADVRIVFVSHGLRFVTDDRLEETPFETDEALAERREDLRGRLLSLAEMHDVKLELCDITRSQVGLEESELYGPVTTVPSGVVRIAELQSRGFSYLKIE